MHRTWCLCQSTMAMLLSTSSRPAQSKSCNLTLAGEALSGAMHLCSATLSSRAKSDPNYSSSCSRKEQD